VDGEVLHFGAGAGWTLTSLTLDEEDPMRPPPELKDGTGTSAFVEFGAEEQSGDLLAGRLVFSESAHEVLGFSMEAEVRQTMVQASWGPGGLGRDLLQIRPSLGLGAGALQLDYRDDTFLDDRTAFAWSITIGVEVQALRHLVFGVSTSLGAFVAWGDTLGEVSSAGAYGAVRF
jgi:hypothetical protein